MTIGAVFVLAAMLLSSGNALNSSFAQTNTGGAAGGNNSDRQNYEEFMRCLEGEEGNRGYATEQQIRDCFAPIYTGGASNSDNGDDNGNNNNGGNTNNNNGGNTNNNNGGNTNNNNGGNNGANS